MEGKRKTVVEVLKVDTKEEKNFDICVGEYTQEEHEYLLKIGHIFETSDGEIVDVSTLVESEFGDDINDSVFDLSDVSEKENKAPEASGGDNLSQSLRMCPATPVTSTQVLRRSLRIAHLLNTPIKDVTLNIVKETLEDAPIEDLDGTEIEDISDVTKRASVSMSVQDDSYSVLNGAFEKELVENEFRDNVDNNVFNLPSDNDKENMAPETPVTSNQVLRQSLPISRRLPNTPIVDIMLYTTKETLQDAPKEELDGTGIEDVSDVPKPASVSMSVQDDSNSVLNRTFEKELVESEFGDNIDHSVIDLPNVGEKENKASETSITSTQVLGQSLPIARRLLYTPIVDITLYTTKETLQDAPKEDLNGIDVEDVSDMPKRASLSMSVQEDSISILNKTFEKELVESEFKDDTNESVFELPNFSEKEKRAPETSGDDVDNLSKSLRMCPATPVTSTQGRRRSIPIANLLKTPIVDVSLSIVKKTLEDAPKEDLDGTELEDVSDLTKRASVSMSVQDDSNSILNRTFEKDAPKEDLDGTELEDVSDVTKRASVSMSVQDDSNSVLNRTFEKDAPKEDLDGTEIEDVSDVPKRASLSTSVQEDSNSVLNRTFEKDAPREDLNGTEIEDVSYVPKRASLSTSVQEDSRNILNKTFEKELVESEFGDNMDDSLFNLSNDNEKENMAPETPVKSNQVLRRSLPIAHLPNTPIVDVSLHIARETLQDAPKEELDVTEIEDVSDLPKRASLSMPFQDDSVSILNKTFEKELVESEFGEAIEDTAFDLPNVAKKENTVPEASCEDADSLSQPLKLFPATPVTSTQVLRRSLRIAHLLSTPSKDVSLNIVKEAIEDGPKEDLDGTEIEDVSDMPKRTSLSKSVQEDSMSILNKTFENDEKECKSPETSDDDADNLSQSLKMFPATPTSTRVLRRSLRIAHLLNTPIKDVSLSIVKETLEDAPREDLNGTGIEDVSDVTGFASLSMLVHEDSINILNQTSEVDAPKEDLDGTGIEDVSDVTRFTSLSMLFHEDSISVLNKTSEIDAPKEELDCTGIEDVSDVTRFASLSMSVQEDSMSILNKTFEKEEQKEDLDDTIETMNKILALADEQEVQEQEQAKQHAVQDNVQESSMGIMAEKQHVLDRKDTPTVAAKAKPHLPRSGTFFSGPRASPQTLFGKRVNELKKRGSLFSPSPPRPKSVAFPKRIQNSNKPSPQPFKAPTPRPTKTVNASSTPICKFNSPIRRSLSGVLAKVDSGLRTSPGASLGLNSPVANYIHSKAAPSPFHRNAGVLHKAQSTGKQWPVPLEQTQAGSGVKVLSMIPRPSLPQIAASITVKRNSVSGVMSASKFNSRQGTPSTSVVPQPKFKQHMYTGPSQGQVRSNNDSSFDQKHQAENYKAQRHLGKRDSGNASIVQNAVVPKQFLPSRPTTGIDSKH